VASLPSPPRPKSSNKGLLRRRFRRLRTDATPAPRQALPDRLSFDIRAAESSTGQRRKKSATRKEKAARKNGRHLPDDEPGGRLWLAASRRSLSVGPGA